jgi:hypothetical protein
LLFYFFKLARKYTLFSQFFTPFQDNYFPEQLLGVFKDMILRDKTSYFAVKIFEFSGLNDKISDKTRAVLGSKFLFV